MNKKIKITTDTSRICVYDLYSLKHRLNDNSDWISSEGLIEMNKGNLALLNVGANWNYEINIIENSKTRTDSSKRIQISCPTGNIFIGAAEKITGGGIEPATELAVDKVAFISIEPGNYKLTFTSHGYNEIELLIEKVFTNPVNNFSEEPQLFYDLEGVINQLLNVGFVYKEEYVLTEESKNLLLNELEDYNNDIEIEPNHELTIYLRAITKVKLGDSKGAIEDFNKALELSDWHKYEILIRRGMYKHKMGDLKGALIDFDKAVEDAPYPSDALTTRASLRFHMGDILGAKNDVDDALNIIWP